MGPSHGLITCNSASLSIHSFSEIISDPAPPCWLHSRKHLKVDFLILNTPGIKFSYTTLVLCGSSKWSFHKSTPKGEGQLILMTKKVKKHKKKLWKAVNLVDHPLDNHSWKRLSGLVWEGAEDTQELLWTKGKPGQKSAVMSPQVEIKGFGVGHDFYSFPQHSMRCLQPHWEDPHSSDPSTRAALSCFFHQQWKPKKPHNNSSKLRRSWTSICWSFFKDSLEKSQGSGYHISNWHHYTTAKRGEYLWAKFQVL